MKKSKFAGVGAVLASAIFAASAHAEGLTEAVTTAAAGAKTDITTAGGVIIGVVCAIAVVAWVRRVIK